MSDSVEELAVAAGHHPALDLVATAGMCELTLVRAASNLGVPESELVDAVREVMSNPFDGGTAAVAQFEQMSEAEQQEIGTIVHRALSNHLRDAAWAMWTAALTADTDPTDIEPETIALLVVAQCFGAARFTRAPALPTDPAEE